MNLVPEQLPTPVNPTLYLDSSHIIILKNMVEHSINDDYTFEKIVRFGNTEKVIPKPGDKVLVINGEKKLRFFSNS